MTTRPDSMFESIASAISRPRQVLTAAALAVTVLAGAPIAQAAEADAHPERQSWSFSGPFGTYDRAQLQRGFKVYERACAACHAMGLVAFRHLGQPGGPEFSEVAVRQLAAEYQIEDGPDEDGEMFRRPGTPPDYLPSPYPNENAARAANFGAYPPDLSVMAKAREGGVDYLYALLTGYQDPPEGVNLREGMSYNPYFPGGQIAMPPPLSDGLIEYTDGTPETVENYGRDVSAFLMWAAEPKLEQRKRMGFQVMAYLFLFAGLLYLSKRKLWRDVEH